MLLKLQSSNVAKTARSGIEPYLPLSTNPNNITKNLPYFEEVFCKMEPAMGLEPATY
jgi:hypothetical protein